MERLSADSLPISIKRSPQYPSSFLLWDDARNDILVVSHAFVVLFSTPPDTGNFVPEGETLPAGIKDFLRKSEPSTQAQVIVTYDCRVEPTFFESLEVLESWAKTKGGYNTDKRSRNPWMSPSSVESSRRYAVTSTLFQARTGFNSKDDSYHVGYDVHPWVKQACVPHNPSWVPNPNLVRTMHCQKDNVLVDITKSSNPTLVPGDVVTMTFKVVFGNNGQYWHMSFAPIQIIRMGQIEGTALGSAGNFEDHGRLNLPRVGQRLKAVAAKQPASPVLRSTRNREKARAAAQRLEDDLRTEDSDSFYESSPPLTQAAVCGEEPGPFRTNRLSPPWKSLSPAGEESGSHAHAKESVGVEVEHSQDDDDQHPLDLSALDERLIAMKDEGGSGDELRAIEESKPIKLRFKYSTRHGKRREPSDGGVTTTRGSKSARRGV